MAPIARLTAGLRLLPRAKPSHPSLESRLATVRLAALRTTAAQTDRAS